jgi:hypothetical protein
MCQHLLDRTRPKELNYGGVESKPFWQEEKKQRNWVRIKPGELVQEILTRGIKSSKGFSLI